MNKFIEAGKIVSTHGIKGELKVQPWCDSPEFLAETKKFYFDNGNKTADITSVRVSKNMAIIKVAGIDTPEQAVTLRNKILYIDRNDIKLEKNCYFVADLIGLEVIDNDDNSKVYGVITEVSETGANDVYHIKSQDGKMYYIPAIKKVVNKTDLEDKKMFITPLKGLFEDED